MRTRTALLASILALTGAATPLGYAEPPHADPHAPPAEHAPARAAPAKTPAKPFTRGAPRAAESTPPPEAAPAVPEHPAAPVAPAATPSDPDAAPTTPEEVLSTLREGNARWVANTPDNPSCEPARRATLAQKGQAPFVTVVTCADSRLPVERMFDRGVGEVFVIRVAGNIAGDSETGTVEYGVAHLRTPLVVVMGHTKCGAVAAAANGAEVHGKIAGLVSRIAPAVERAKRQSPNAGPDELAAAAVRENVWQTVFDLLRQSPTLRESMTQGNTRVVGAVCDVATGRVDFMGEHPWQAELLAAMAAEGVGAPQATAHEDK